MTPRRPARTRLSPLRLALGLTCATTAASPHRYRPGHYTLLRGPVERKQFVSLAFGQAAGKAGIARSMGSRGDCYDKAVAESFFATLKKELIHRRSWPDREELRRGVFDYIEIFYNATRRHSTLGMLSPVRYEERYSLTQPNNSYND